MKILLLNDNPVVNKLVTLSANKTSDELDVVNTVQELENRNYDLVVIDDSVYSEDILDELKDKIKYKKSLYIFSKNSVEADGFTSKLKKPFLPTDLVELFSTLGKEANTIELEEDEEISLEDELLLDEELSLDDTDEISLDDLTLDLEDEINLDDDLTLDLEEELLLDDEEISLDDEVSFEDDLLEESEESKVNANDELLDEGILDSEDVQEVQNLLEEEEDEDEELELDEITQTLEEEIDLEDESLESEDENLALEDELELEDSLVVDSLVEDIAEEEINEEIETLEEEVVVDEDSIENIEDQIENALDELSDEELESEVDEETLVNIATSELDSIDALNTRDLKLAFGEDISDIEEEVIPEVANEPVSKEITTDNDGVEALKNLLTALSDKNVAASMKGMKISINITLGDN